MALKENKTPEEIHAKKVARFDAIVQHAKQILPTILSNALPNIQNRLRANPPQNEEDFRSTKRMEFDKACEDAFLVVESFADVRKRRRGAYMAD